MAARGTAQYSTVCQIADNAMDGGEANRAENRRYVVIQFPVAHIEDA